MASGDFIDAELARRSFLDYAARVDPTWQRAAHLDLIADALDRVERREIKRLCIAMPPRHGKTKAVSQLFPSYFFGRNPNANIVLASYGGELAEMNSRRVRDYVADGRYPFPTTLREDSRAANRWQTEQGGTLIAVGCGAGLTGYGADLAICDDLVKDRQEAESALSRKSVSEWFSDVMMTRLHPDAALILVGTMWHEDDIMNQVLRSPAGEQFEKLILPLIAVDGDVLGRKPGEFLWPARFGPDDVPSVEKGEISERSFSALYQQRPAPAKGNVFLREWFERRYTEVPVLCQPVEITRHAQGGVNMFFTHTLTRPVTKIQAIDCAAKDGVGNDFSVIVTLVHDGFDAYVADVDRQRVQFNDLLAMVLVNYDRHAPSVIYIEDASNGIPVISTLRTMSRLPVVPVTARGSKLSRYDAVTTWFQTKRVLLPERAPWVEGFIDELTSIPVSRHDDQADAITLGLSMLAETLHRQEIDVHNRRALEAMFLR